MSVIKWGCNKCNSLTVKIQPVVESIRQQSQTDIGSVNSSQQESMDQTTFWKAFQHPLLHLLESGIRSTSTVNIALPLVCESNSEMIALSFLYFLSPAILAGKTPSTRYSNPRFLCKQTSHTVRSHQVPQRWRANRCNYHVIHNTQQFLTSQFKGLWPLKISVTYEVANKEIVVIESSATKNSKLADGIFMTSLYLQLVIKILLFPRRNMN